MGRASRNLDGKGARKSFSHQLELEHNSISHTELIDELIAVANATSERQARPNGPRGVGGGGRYMGAVLEESSSELQLTSALNDLLEYASFEEK